MSSPETSVVRTRFAIFEVRKDGMSLALEALESRGYKTFEAAMGAFASAHEATRAKKLPLAPASPPSRAPSSISA